MKKIKAKIFTAILVALCIFLLTGTINQAVKKKKYEPPYGEGKLYDVGESKLYAEIGGNPEGVTVVFESGLSDGAFSWCTYAPLLHNDFKTFIYDKSGIGRSETSSLPRTLDRESYELKELLTAADIDTPFILVGHSRGGVIVRRFSQLYPELVLGVVLIDTTNEVMFDDNISKAFYKMNSFFYHFLAFTNNFGVPRLLHDMGSPLLEREIDEQIIATKGMAYFNEYQEHSFKNSFISTVANQTGTVAQLFDLIQKDLQPLDIPTYIIYEIPCDEEKEDTEKMVGEYIKTIQIQFPLSQSKIVYDAGHYIHVTMPEVVTEGIEWILAQ